MSVCPDPFRKSSVRTSCEWPVTAGPGVTIGQIAHDFGIHPMTLSKWIRQADIDDGARPGRSRSESADLRAANRRIKLLEQENEVLRRAAAYLSQANLAGKGSTRS